MFCNQCGHRNPPEANFCSSCGGGLSQPTHSDDHTTITFQPVEGDLSEDLTVTVPDLGEGTGVLVVKRGPNAGSKYLLDRDLTVAGRHPKAEIFLDDVTVSRRHAEFIRHAGGYRVRDVGSLNGTYRNRERIDEGDLANGDEIQIGTFKLVFLAGSGEA